MPITYTRINKFFHCNLCTQVPRNTYFCILYFFFARCGISISSWILMCMTFDRYLAVRFPFRARTLCTVHRAKVATVAVVAIQVVGHLPYFWRRFDPSGRTLSEKCNYDLPDTHIKVYEGIRMVVFDRVLPGRPRSGIVPPEDFLGQFFASQF